MSTTIRRATPADVPLILDLIKALADYEHALDQVIATEEQLTDWLFGKQVAEVIIAQDGDEPVGFALYFHNFSTWLGRAGIYLEDLFVLPEHRGHGHGKALLRALAQTALERGCGRLEWACLNWNQPSIDFYLSLGAERMTEWNTYRLTGPTLQALADSE
ncbi:MAG: GNAT family N-acetyltransferase [Coriobacteriia bacterium]|nr:GNAT family N-acetyltransferase [Coriobacteriia bacterium]